MRKPIRHLVALSLALSVSCGAFALLPTVARAEDAVDAELTARVEAATAEYHEAQARVDELNSQIATNEARIAEIEAELPEQKLRAAASVRALYKFNASSDGLLELVLTADDFNQFIATIQYLEIIQNKNFEEIDALVQMEDELAVATAALDVQRAEADEQLQRAELALEEAEEAREAARQAAAAQSVAEQQVRQAALEEARAHEGETFETSSGNTVTVEVKDTPATQEDEPAEEQQSEPEPEAEPDPTPALSSREAFVATWAARIDAYNAGYPLGGYGYAFAEAAYDYGVDPRFSPAIARIESTSGLYCFESCNAWGWGDAAWGDWDTAIRSHVRGLGAGYGYTLSYAGACMYCPPNADLWYSMVGSEMSSIWYSDSL